MTLSVKRQHMMFAKAEKLDIFQDDHFIIIFLKHSTVQDILIELSEKRLASVSTKKKKGLKKTPKRVKRKRN